MSVSAFGMWFIGLSLLFIIGLGAVGIKTELFIKSIEKDDWGRRTGKRASKWFHRLELFCLGMMFIGLLMLVAAGRCLFYPGPFCVALYP